MLKMKSCDAGDKTRQGGNRNFWWLYSNDAKRTRSRQGWLAMLASCRRRLQQLRRLSWKRCCMLPIIAFVTGTIKTSALLKTWRLVALLHLVNVAVKTCCTSQVPRFYSEHILDKVKMYNNYNDYQFGFKEGHSTALCTTYADYWVLY